MRGAIIKISIITCNRVKFVLRVKKIELNRVSRLFNLDTFLNSFMHPDSFICMRTCTFIRIVCSMSSNKWRNEVYFGSMHAANRSNSDSRLNFFKYSI